MILARLQLSRSRLATNFGTAEVEVNVLDLCSCNAFFSYIVVMGESMSRYSI